MTNLQLTALQVILFINERGKANSREIAKGIGISIPHMEGILSKLKKSDIVRATRGPGGGYFMARKLGDIRVTEVLALYQGSINSAEGKMLNSIINKHLSSLTMECLKKSLLIKI
ncbi:RrF2 family transcriptional regulator [Photobacterium damselae]|uniref:RrF2 family transcriptional regulator n=1 Tax=Photobacterium damselae TaxID=38293 RepID=UPI004068B34A